MDQVNVLLPNMMLVATIERHDESVVPFQKQLGWNPGTFDDCLRCKLRVYQDWLFATAKLTEPSSCPS